MLEPTMRALHPDSTSTKDDALTPVGLFGYQPPGVDQSELGDGGFFLDLFELEYQVVRADGTIATPWASVDVDRESVTTDALLDHDAGLYAPDITVASGETNYGVWTIQWRFRVESGGEQLTSETRFRLVDPAQPLVIGYAQVQDMIDEGVPTATYTVARMAAALTKASLLFEEWTGRFFEHRLMSVDVDGRGGPIKQLQMPIIGLSGAAFTFTTFSPADLPIEQGDLRVYNRHIRQGLLRPDDRDAPRVEFLTVSFSRYPRDAFVGDTDLLSSALGFPESQQNVTLEGVFGYTDPVPGLAFGVTPELVKEAVLRIAMRKLAPLWTATAGGTTVGVSGPVTSEKTFDQAVTYKSGNATSSPAYTGYFTGDPEIDQIILTYMRPMQLGSA